VALSPLADGADRLFYICYKRAWDLDLLKLLLPMPIEYYRKDFSRRVF